MSARRALIFKQWSWSWATSDVGCQSEGSRIFITPSRSLRSPFVRFTTLAFCNFLFFRAKNLYWQWRPIAHLSRVFIDSRCSKYAYVSHFEAYFYHPSFVGWFPPRLYVHSWFEEKMFQWNPKRPLKPPRHALDEWMSTRMMRTHDLNRRPEGYAYATRRAISFRGEFMLGDFCLCVEF